MLPCTAQLLKLCIFFTRLIFVQASLSENNILTTKYLRFTVL